MLESRKDKGKTPKSAKPQCLRKKRRLIDGKVPLSVASELSPSQNISIPESNTKQQGLFSRSDSKCQSQSLYEETEFLTTSNLATRLSFLNGSFLDLSVRTFTQPIGLRNQWAEGGRGCVEFNNLKISVKAFKRPESNGSNNSSISVGETGAASSLSSHQGEALINKNPQHSVDTVKTEQKGKKNGTSVDTQDSLKDKFNPSAETMKTISKRNEVSFGQNMVPFDDTSGNANSSFGFVQKDTNNDESKEDILLEDTITSETIFVGENCSIVWNSIVKKLSICLMFCSVNGYIASWSALIAMQGKAYPHFELDFLSLSVQQALDDIRESQKRGDAPTLSSAPRSRSYTSQTQSECLPYSVFLHDEYNPPLGFIEKHFISLCLMQFGHLAFPELYNNRSVVLALLGIANEDLIEELLGDKAYPLLIKGLGCTLPPKTWMNPDCLSNLTIPQELASIISKDLRAAQLLSIVKELTSKVELFKKISIVIKRLRNEIMCALLSNNEILQQTKKALEIIPPMETSSQCERSSYPIPNGSSNTTECKYTSSPSRTSNPLENQEFQRVEQQVLANLRFLRSCITLGISELGRDSVGPVVVKAFQGGILEALSLVAERYAMPPGAMRGFLNDSLGHHHSPSTNSHKSESLPKTPSRNWYSPPIHRELSKLLGTTITSLNEERDEQLMNEIVRSPILANPHKYNGLMVFMLRQVAFDLQWRSLPKGKFTLQRLLRTSNSFVIFDVLGLHDNESNISIGHPMSPKSIDIRYRFHRYFILNYLQQAINNTLPPPPSSLVVGLEQLNGALSEEGPLYSNLVYGLQPYVSPLMIRLLDYFIALTSCENRELVLRTIVSHKGHLLRFVEQCYRIATSNANPPRTIGLDVLCTNTHFIKTVLEHIGCSVASKEQLSFSMNDPLTQTISQSLVLTICRRLIYENDIFGSMLEAYRKIGGLQCNTMFHSMVLSTFDAIEKGALKSIDNINDSLSKIRDYIFLKYFEILPDRYARRFRETLLAHASMGLGCKTTPEITDSVSCLSFTSGEIPHSSSELRFVDEIEASNVQITGNRSPETAQIISLSEEGGSSTQELNFLKILQTHNGQLTLGNPFGEEPNKLVGTSSPIETILESIPASPMNSSESSSLAVQNPTPLLNDQGDTVPILGKRLSLQCKSLETEPPFHLKPTPPATRSLRANRGRSYSSISFNLMKDGGDDEAKATLSKTASKYVLSLPVEPLAAEESDCESNTTEKSSDLSSLKPVAHKKESSRSGNDILSGKNVFALPCLTKNSFSASHTQGLKTFIFKGTI